MTVQDYINVVCPELLTVSGYNSFIELAQETLSPDYFGDKYNYAVALKASHLYVLNRKRDGESGIVSGKTEGRLNITYTNSGKSNSELELTSYGKELLQLIKNIKPGIIVGSVDIYNNMYG